MKISGIVLGLSLLGLSFATEYYDPGRRGCSEPSINYGGCGDGQDFYRIGSKIECYCQPGYELDVSYAYVVCKRGGWKPRLPKCTKVVYKCPVPEQPVYGSYAPAKSYYVYPNSITYTCDYGYELSPSSSRVRQCQKNGKWDEPEPKCVPKVYKCPKPKQPAYGSYTPTKSYYYFPDEITYNCEYGYYLNPSSSRVRQCQKNGKWNKPAPKCEPRKCPPRHKPQYGWIDPEQEYYTPGQKIVFYCSKGYHLVGKAEDKCNIHGNWDVNKTPKCVKVCKVDYPEDSQGSYEPVKPYYYPGDMITFTCDYGYCLRGDAKRTCQDNGKWNPEGYPTCVRSCDEPDVPYGSVTGSDPPYCAGDYVWFDCDDGYTNIGDKDARCQADGSWTGYADCKPVVKKCKKPYIENGGFYPGQKWYQVGDVVHFYCDDGYVLNGDRTATCRKKGQWTVLPTCERKIGKGSCKGRCGGDDDDYYSYDCQCDYRCKRFYNCCKDYDRYCKGYFPW